MRVAQGFSAVAKRGAAKSQRAVLRMETAWTSASVRRSAAGSPALRTPTVRGVVAVLRGAAQRWRSASPLWTAILGASVGSGAVLRPAMRRGPARGFSAVLWRAGSA